MARSPVLDTIDIAGFNMDTSNASTRSARRVPSATTAERWSTCGVAPLMPRPAGHGGPRRSRAPPLLLTLADRLCGHTRARLGDQQPVGVRPSHSCECEMPTGGLLGLVHRRIGSRDQLIGSDHWGSASNSEAGHDVHRDARNDNF